MARRGQAIDGGQASLQKYRQCNGQRFGHREKKFHLGV